MYAAATALMWIPFAWACYVYVLYPLIVITAAKFAGRPVALPNSNGGPSVTEVRVGVIICAHNEEDSIFRRVTNLLHQTRSPDELIVASDGSTDHTVDTAASVGHPHVRILESRTQRGRALVHNEAVAQATADLIVFTDARTQFRADALEELVLPFERSDVGITTGDLRWEGRATGVKASTNLYWRLERALRRAESDLGWLHTASGPIMCARRSCFLPLRSDEDVDFTTPFDAISRGYRVVFVEAAIASDEEYASARAEYRARMRMVTKNLPGTLRKLKRLPPSRFPAVWFSAVSHKIMRWIAPVGLVPFLAGALINIDLLAAQVALSVLALMVVGTAIGCGINRMTARHVPLVEGLFRFAVANAGMAAGVLRASFGNRISKY